MVFYGGVGVNQKYRCKFGAEWMGQVRTPNMFCGCSSFVLDLLPFQKAEVGF